MKVTQKTFTIRNIPAPIHRAAKSRAAKHGETMKTVLLRLVTEYAKKGGAV